MKKRLILAVPLIMAGVCGGTSLPASAQSPPSATALDSGIAAAIHADTAASVELPSGEALWIFGDTTAVNGTSTVGAYGYPHDAFALQSPGSTSWSVQPGPYGYGWQQVPNWSDGTYFWPATAVVDGSTLYVFGERIQGVSPFTVVGDYAAEFTTATPPVYEGIVPVPGSGGEVWGGSAQAPGGWWLFGTRQTGGSNCLSACKTGNVAFVPSGEEADSADWRITDGALPASLDLGTAVSPERLGSGWVAFTKVNDILGTQLERLSASSPTATWSVTGTWTAPDSVAADETYGVQVHPEQPAASGQILVSVCENGTVYDPQFIYLPS
jgi:hypothetical protein